MPSDTIGNNTVYKAHASMFTAISTIAGDVIYDSGSLKIHRNATTGLIANVVRNTSPRSFDSGFAYATFRKTVTGAGANPESFGLSCCQNQEDLTAGSGTCLSLAMRWNSGLTQVTANLIRFTAGISSSSGTILASGTPFNATVNDDITIYLRWVQSAAFGGVQLRGWHILDNALPDITLTPSVEAIFASSHITSSGEGEFVTLATTGVTCTFSIDRVGRFPYAVGAL